MYASNLGIFPQSRFERNGEAADPDAAVDARRQAAAYAGTACLSAAGFLGSRQAVPNLAAARPIQVHDWRLSLFHYKALLGEVL